MYVLPLLLQGRVPMGTVDANTTVEIWPPGPNVTVMKITPWMKTAKHAGVGDMQPRSRNLEETRRRSLFMYL